MAPLSQALSPRLIHSGQNGAGIRKDTYQGVPDSDWSNGPLLHGGYVFSLVLDACMKSQENTRHPDPIHVTAHFLSPSFISDYVIEIQVIRTGSRFSNLQASWVQKGKTSVMFHLIFGTLPAFDAPPSSEKHHDIGPDHPLYRRIPMLTHPTASTIDNTISKVVIWIKRIRLASDTRIDQLNKEKFRAKHHDGLVGGVWVELKDKVEELSLAMLPCLADLYRRTPLMLNDVNEEPRMRKLFSTVTMTLEFKRKLPRRGAPGISHRTIGIFSRNSFLDQGRHDVYGELWTAPDDVGEAGQVNPSDESWKKRMRCIGVTTQMGLCLPPPFDMKKYTVLAESKL